MLFLKYVSDVWRDHYEQYRQQYGDDDECIRRRMAREKFVLPAGADYYALYEQRGANNLGEQIDIALADFDSENVAGTIEDVAAEIEKLPQHHSDL